MLWGYAVVVSLPLPVMGVELPGVIPWDVRDAWIKETI